MSRFLVLGEDGDGLGLALRLKREGHSVKMWIRHNSPKNIGKNLVETEGYEFGQTVIADCTGFGSLLDLLRDSGVYTFAGSSFCEKLEEDRKFSGKLMDEVGIETPLSVEASSWEEAAELVEEVAEESDFGKVVIKPEGLLSGVLPSYVAKSVEDAKDTLKRFEQQTGDSTPELTLQQFVDGIALSTEGWFDGQNWIKGMFNHTIERKQSLNGDLGPSIGCSGNVVWKCSHRDEIVKETLIKLTKKLRVHNYVGPLDINCVVNDKGVYGLEFTPRFGYDAFPSLLYGLCNFDFGDFVSRCVSGNDVSDVALREGFAVGVRLRLGKDKDAEAMPIRGLEKDEDFETFYPYAVHREEDGSLIASGGDRDPGVVTAFDEDSIDKAFEKAYKLLEKLELKDKQYRTDLAEALSDDIDKLNEVMETEVVA